MPDQGCLLRIRIINPVDALGGTLLVGRLHRAGETACDTECQYDAHYIYACDDSGSSSHSLYLLQKSISFF